MPGPTTDKPHDGTALDAAYRAAHYRIDVDPPLVLHIGEPHPALPSRFPAGGVFVTACNPRSRRLRPVANARRMRALCRAVERLGHAWLPGCGLDPQGQWPDEPSLWVPALSCAAGQRLAHQFGQNALVYCGPDGVPRLIGCVPAPPRHHSGHDSASPVRIC